MTQPPIPAGWYPNPDGTQSTRWWDGTQWTEAVTAGPGPPPPPPPPRGPPPPPPSPSGSLYPQIPVAGYPATGSPYGSTPAYPAVGPHRAPIAGRTGLILAVVFLGVAVAVGVPSLVFVVRTAVDQIIDAPMMTVPGSAGLSLQQGDYYLYDPAGSGGIGTGDLQVSGPNHSSPVPFAPTGTQSFTRGGVSYTAAVGFHASQAGWYRITVRTGSSAPHRVIVALSFTSLAASIAGWAVGLVAAVLIGIAGIVLLIVSLVARSRAKRDAAAAGF